MENHPLKIMEDSITKIDELLYELSYNKGLDAPYMDHGELVELDKKLKAARDFLNCRKAELRFVDRHSEDTHDADYIKSLVRSSRCAKYLKAWM